jgi:RNA polymerase sigma-70 factor (ECF subfamily)
VPDLRHAADLDTIAVGQALRALPEEFRTPFLCFYMQGMPFREIAALTEAPLGTVKSRLFTARARLREMLAPTPAAGERALAPERPQEG